MSRRFGRNQRRKMRERIARLEQAGSYYHDQLNREQSRRRRLEHEMIEWAGRIVDLLGSESAFARDIAEKSVEQDYLDHIRTGAPVRMTPQNRFVASPDDTNPAATYSARQIIDTFATYATPERDPMAYACRFVIRAPDGAAAVMMDERTIQILRARGDGQLMRFLAQQLIEPWCKKEVGR